MINFRSKAETAFAASRESAEDTQPFRRESIDQIIHALIEHDAAECAEKFRHSTTPPPPAD